MTHDFVRFKLALPACLPKVSIFDWAKKKRRKKNEEKVETRTRTCELLEKMQGKTQAFKK